MRQFLPRIASFVLGGLAVSLGSCTSQDSEEAILSDCSRAGLSSIAIDDCLRRARVLEAVYPSPTLESLIAALGGAPPAQVATLPPPPPDEDLPGGQDHRWADRLEDFDATAAPPDYADNDAPPADEDMWNDDTPPDDDAAGPPENDTDLDYSEAPPSELDDESAPEDPAPDDGAADDEGVPPAPPPN